ncbi:unnamed protein product [Citrullus colocynthis]|uniref:Uncharacterized protein n=1 Tax=Citrullus colocynthis TaxID=252529 RepID=A0ABP0Z7I1_9ROSI
MLFLAISQGQGYGFWGKNSRELTSINFVNESEGRGIGFLRSLISPLLFSLSSLLSLSLALQAFVVSHFGSAQLFDPTVFVTACRPSYTRSASC